MFAVTVMHNLSIKNKHKMVLKPQKARGNLDLVSNVPKMALCKITFSE